MVARGVFGQWWKPRVMKLDYDGCFDLDFERPLSVSARIFRDGRLVKDKTR